MVDLERLAVSPLHHRLQHSTPAFNNVLPGGTCRSLVVTKLNTEMTLTFCPSCHSSIDLDSDEDTPFPYDSHLRFRLDNELLPTSAEKAHSVQTIISLSNDLLTIRREIVRLNRRLSDLDILKEDYTRSLELHHASISVLETIFEVALVSCATPAEQRALPWRLSQVCRRWSNIAIAYPSLWTCVCVWPNDKNEYVQTLLERSQPRPIQVHFSESDSVAQFQTILKSAARWETANFTFGSAFPEEGLKHFEDVPPDVDLPLLESFTVQYGVADDEVPPDLEVPFLHRAPRLAAVNVYGRIHVPFLPWNTITSCSLINRSEQNLHDLVMVSHNLTKAILRFTPRKFFVDPEEYDAFVHHSLQELVLVGDVLPRWISRMRLPALKHLYVQITSRGDMSNVDSSLETVDTLVRESGCSLKALSFQIYDLTMELHRSSLLSILCTCSPTLQSLIVYTKADQMWWICDILTLCGIASCDVLRGLTELRLCGWEENGSQFYTADTFQLMTESRRAWLSILVVEVECGYGGPDDAALEYMDDLIADGMDVAFIDMSRGPDAEQRLYHFRCSPKDVWYDYVPRRLEIDCGGSVAELYK
ncbi:hypothetical protein BDZ89DRAFT_1073354 [Hymenopellis radicata]|nr:hypothetical protein BDZ89DRAFT_1073354 [Hymenopellis radicata]